MIDSLNVASVSIIDDMFDLKISLALTAIIAVAIIALSVFSRSSHTFFRRAKIKISIPKFYEAEFIPNTDAMDLAHKIWTELSTRKAAIPFDEENDVIVEIYDSWHEMFGRIRDRISAVSGEEIKINPGLRSVVNLSVKILNDGLRPHLTKWQARLRSWDRAYSDESKSPQERQRQFEDYKFLIADLKQVNGLLMSFKQQLEEITNICEK